MPYPRLLRNLVPCLLLSTGPVLFADSLSRKVLSTADGGWGADAQVNGTTQATHQNFGGSQIIAAKDGGARRKIYLRFDLKGVPLDRIAAARLRLTIASMDLTQSAQVDGITFRVFGLNDGARAGAARLGEDWPEMEITYGNAPANVHDERMASVGAGIERGGQARILGQSTLQGSLFSVGQSFTLLDSVGDPRVLNFLRADTNGHVTFIITRVRGSPDDNLLFAAREHTRGHAPPTLELDFHP